jgi:hypothetical protein
MDYPYDRFLEAADRCYNDAAASIGMLRQPPHPR